MDDTFSQYNQQSISKKNQGTIIVPVLWMEQKTRPKYVLILRKEKFEPRQLLLDTLATCSNENIPNKKHLKAITSKVSNCTFNSCHMM